jgi:ABC-type transporter Mla subunit MlaD
MPDDVTPQFEALAAQYASLTAQLKEMHDTLQQILTQNALLTDTIKAIRTGQFAGPGSLDGIYCALKGGLPQPDYTATFP